jgi:hypothetical protein
MWFLPSRDLPIFVVPVVRLWSKLAFIENLGTSGTSKPGGEVKTPSHRGVTIYSGFSVHRACIVLKNIYFLLLFLLTRFLPTEAAICLGLAAPLLAWPYFLRLTCFLKRILLGRPLFTRSALAARRELHRQERQSWGWR